MRQAIVVVSFGTSVPEARAAITAVEKTLEQAASGYICVRAFTSPTIRRILSERGEDIPSLTEALDRLCGEGVQRVVVQPTHLLYGYEYDRLRQEAEAFSDRFASLVMGRPLLADTAAIRRFAARFSDALAPEKNGAAVLLGHGTEHFANTAYPALQTALRLEGRADLLVGTVEGWPGLEEVLGQLEGPRHVRLVPLMLVAGDHARQDMAVTWKGRLEAAGHTVTCSFTGLGERPWVQAMYRERLLENI